MMSPSSRSSARMSGSHLRRRAPARWLELRRGPARSLADAHRRENKVELYESERQRRQALHAGEDMKKTLLKTAQRDEHDWQRRLGLARLRSTLDVFEEAMSRLFIRTHMLVEQALDSARLEANQLDHVCLVGGGTRMPRIREMLRGLFGFEPTACGNVDECVALGAALFSLKGASVREVCNHSYGTLALIEDAATGVETYANSIVIQKNTPIPCQQSQTYVTSEDNENGDRSRRHPGRGHDPKYCRCHRGKMGLDVPPCAAGRMRDHGDQQLRCRPASPRARHGRRSGRTREVRVSYQGLGVLGDDATGEQTAAFGTLSSSSFR